MRVAGDAVAVSPFPKGRLAQLVRAPALQAGSRGFESLTAHHIQNQSFARVPISDENSKAGAHLQQILVAFQVVKDASDRVFQNDERSNNRRQVACVR